MVWNKKISALLAVVALCGVATVGAADYTILEKAEKVETTVYGTTQTGALNTRIAALDKVLNGSDSVSGSVDSKTDELYKEVYGNTGSDLSMVAAVNMMQRQYSGTVTNDALTTRVGELEEGISGKVGTGSLRSRVAALRSAMLGKRKFVSQVVTIPAGTVVEMTNEDPINSKDLTEGDRLRFSVAEDIKVGDVIAIPRGMEAEGTVSKARKAGRFGRDGKIEIEYDSVHASDGSPVQLVVGEKTKEQYKRTAGAVGASAAGAIILGPVGLVGGFFTAIFGGWDSALVTLVVFMAIDFFTGIITAMMKKSKHTESGGLSSKAGWFGLAKKVCTLMLIVVAVRMDILLNTNYIRDAVCISFCLNELLSIVENTSLMGIPYPPAIQKAIDVLQTKIGRTEETTDKEDK